MPKGHPLTARESATAGDIVKHPLIGIDPSDLYGRIMAGIFSRQELAYEVPVSARFGPTVCALVGNGLGIAVTDEFTLAGGNWPKLRALEIAEPTAFQTTIAYRRDAVLSSYCERFIGSMREQVTTGEVAFRKAYVSSLVDHIEVDDREIRICGRKDVLE